MVNFGHMAKENIKKHNANWPQVSNYPYVILKIGDPGSGKPNTLFCLIGQRLDIDKIYLHAKDPYEAKYQLLINKHEGVGLEEFNNSKSSVE